MESRLIYEGLKRSGYPEAFIRKYSSPTTPKLCIMTVPKKNVYIQFSFKGDDVASLISRRLRCALERTFPAAELVCLFKTTRIPLPQVKDSFPVLSTSHCVYKYECTCGSTYVGRTERKLSVRAAEHLPKWIYGQVMKSARSSITKHVVEAGCTGTTDAFRIVSRQNNATLLRWAEAVAIRRLRPNLCVQKEMVLTLALPW
jgi:hypothetical protein